MTRYAVFNDTESRDRALSQFVVGKEDGCFDIEASGSREIKFNRDASGDDAVDEFYEGCGEDFVVEERQTADPLADLDAGLERDAEESVVEGREYWTRELARFDVGEQVVDLVEQRPLTREEIVKVLEALQAPRE